MHDMTASTHATMRHRRTLVLLLLIAATLTSGAPAFAASDKPRGQKAERYRAEAQKPVQPVRPRQPVACSEFGPGFVRMPGSDSCMRFGGSVGIGVGGVP
jgi:hypothetical protein